MYLGNVETPSVNDVGFFCCCSLLISTWSIGTWSRKLPFSRAEVVQVAGAVENRLTGGKHQKHPKTASVFPPLVTLINATEPWKYPYPCEILAGLVHKYPYGPRSLYIYIASLFRKTHRQGKTFLLIQLAMDVLAILSHYQVYHQFWYLKPFSKWWCQIPGIHRYPTAKLSG